MSDSPSQSIGRWAARDAEDAALLERIARGDRVAFESLYRAYFARLSRFFQRMLRRPSLVEEAINDTMYVVWRRAGTFRATARGSTWIFGIAYRRGLKALVDLDDPVEANGSELPDDRPSAEDQLLNAEVHRLLDAALSQMSAEHRAVIELCYYHACPYREIAQITGCPVETVKTRMFYARRRLHDLLEGHRKDLPWADASSNS
jgi:RNA polymerase sigma-70 factor (ECF subfamily)